jgi:DNA-binding response OmpR family regulator
LSDFFTVQEAASVEVAWRAILSWNPDVVVIANQTLKHSNFDLLKSVRNEDAVRQAGLVVLIQEQMSLEEEGLFLKGTDLVLPADIAPSALVLRLSALLRRIDGFQNLQDTVITLGSLTISPRAKKVEDSGQIITLTPTQYALLFALACHPNQVLSRAWLKQNIWKGQRVSPRSIDAHISKLKKLLPGLGDAITNVYGEGYILLTPKKAA